MSKSTPPPAPVAPLRRSPPRRQGGRSAAVTARAFAATLRILAAEGFDGVTFAAVGARAGIHRATLHRRWASPAFLVLEALAQQIGERIAIPDTGALASDLAGALAQLAAFLASDAGRAALHAATRIEHDAGVAALLRQLWAGRFAEIGAIFDRAVARGELAADADREALFAAAAGAVYFRTIVLGEAVDAAWIERVLGTLRRA